MRGVLDVVDAHTEPGEFRDNLYGRWYRGKLLGRLGRNAFLGREEEHRRGVLAAVRELMQERFPERLDAELPPALRMRAALARRDDYDGLVALAEYERALRSVTRVRGVRGDGTWMTLKAESWLRERGAEPLRVVRRAGRVLLVLPDALAGHFSEGELDVTDALPDARVQFLLKPEGDETDWIVPVEPEASVPEAADDEPVRATVMTAGRIAPTIAAGGTAPLAPGRYDLRVVVWIAGFTAHSFAQRTGEPFSLEVTEGGRVFAAGHVPEPAPERTPREKLRFGLGRLRLRARGPRAAA